MVFLKNIKNHLLFWKTKNEITKFDNKYINYKKNFKNEVIHHVIRTHPEKKDVCM